MSSDRRIDRPKRRIGSSSAELAAIVANAPCRNEVGDGKRCCLLAGHAGLHRWQDGDRKFEWG